ncbi:MAG: thiosulfate oxidation carrier complex protein SoxZ [Methylophilaceae bacterium]|jgi:sulfur-oxidizing protein SoxZ|uniref:thiosulfate oxidation carrier complex protein SoxZ n=1 Tax=Methylobacillus sp. MM3 TaxID=1848039 RepID=UPI0007E23E28|nr:thiosulfate oxidation carrier complex protein SoxZ [Methylobacillus sp. MM3]OAJ70654.1 thiosulfate oxidation carrier complex protein SoxZ [Methylobacillus sp. MM3]
MADMMKIRARLKDGVTEVKVLMIHPMETGRRINDVGETVPAHFIQMVTATLNGKTVLEAQWGTGISKNPYLTFRLRGASLGDKLAVSWVDNKGATNAIEGVVEGS